MRRALPILLLFALHLKAADVWVLQGYAVSGSSCSSTSWTGMASFYNTGAASVAVRLLDVTGNDDVGGRPSELIVPSRQLTQTFAWNYSPAPLWVLHLDVPNGVLVESRLNVGVRGACRPAPALDFSAARGKIALPTRTSLVPANEPHVHLGTDLGTINARLNVIVYNAGSNSASGRIEIRRACDDAIIDTRDLTIAAKAVTQITNLRGTSTCDPFAYSQNAPFVSYAIVTIDQPSLSWISSISNDHPTTVVYAVE